MATPVEHQVESELLTVGQVARLLQLNPETIRVWLREGKLRGVRLGANRAGWRIRASDLAHVLPPKVQAQRED